MSADDINPEHINADLVRALHAKVKDLESEVERLQGRVDELESGGSSASAGSVTTDPYDQAILDQLDEGEVVTTPQLMNRYLQSTKIADKKKAKNRAKALRDGPEFESLGYGEHRYVGGDDDE